MGYNLTGAKRPVDPMISMRLEGFPETCAEEEYKEKESSGSCCSCLRINRQLEYEKPYFLTCFNTTGFALWNLGYLVIPSWRRIPWKATGKPVSIIFVDPHVKGVFAGSNSDTDTVTSKKAKEGYTMMENVELLSPAANDGMGTAHTNANIDATSNKTKAETAEAGERGSSAFTTNNRVVDSSDDDNNDNCEKEFLPCNYDGVMEKITPYSKFLLRCACLFCPFWFVANYLFNLSLSRTSVASNTVLSSTSFIWALLLSVVLLGHRVSLFKVGAVGVNVLVDL
ncbi:hypothetical protein LSM04_005924 [Trypanosoma melophagium]|uniref:uncharacterized protein n=1 Tax=Trypanosoma melophagium TaxID=715481 RepID=UPI00351A5BEF|nr:hypothetical protein LSM04_005924 [Trypanosoma melophagium]